MAVLPRSQMVHADALAMNTGLCVDGMGHNLGRPSRSGEFFDETLPQ